MKPSKISSLITGFLASLGLIILAYFTAKTGPSGTTMSFILMGLAALQAVVQLLFFFNLKTEKAPHWYWIMFLFTILIMVVVVGGSLWIMSNLNYNMMM